MDIPVNVVFPSDPSDEEGLQETGIDYRVLELDLDTAHTDLKIDVGRWEFLQLLQATDEVQIKVGASENEPFPAPIGIIDLRKVDAIYLTNTAGGGFTGHVARFLFSTGFGIAAVNESRVFRDHYPRDIETDEITGITNGGATTWDFPVVGGTGTGHVFGVVLKAPSTNPDNVEITRSGGGGFGPFVLEAGQEVRINVRRGGGGFGGSWALSFLASSGGGGNTIWALVEYADL